MAQISFVLNMANMDVSPYGHGLTDITQRFCLLIYQIEITNKQNMKKSKCFFYKFTLSALQIFLLPDKLIP